MIAAALAQVAALLHPAREPWWVIGSAAVWLHGADTMVADIDLLMGEADAARLIADWPGGVTIGAPNDRFRSDRFARLEGAALPVEVMAGLRIRVDGRWCAVRPVTREARGGVFVPARAELVAILLAFGRAKDRMRAAMLE